jgi:hypothetical protein
MPKVPTITAASSPALLQAPGAGAYHIPEQTGLTTLQRGLSSLSGKLADIAQNVQDQKADLEITESAAVYKARVRLAKEEILSNPDVENATQEFLNQEARIHQESVAGLTMSSTRAAFAKMRAKALPDATADMALGEMQMAVLKQAAGVRRSVELHSNEAALATTTADRDAINAETDELLSRSVARRIITPDVAETLTKRRDERVDMAWARRRAELDPIGTAESLEAGEYKGIPQDRAQSFAHVLMERAKRQQDEEIRRDEKAQAAFAKWFGEQKHQKETELAIAAGAGTLSVEQLNEAAIDWQIHPERYQAIKNVLDKPDKKELSDPDTLMAVSIDSNSGTPKMSNSTLAQLRQAGLLNQADFDRESQKRLVIQHHNEAQARIGEGRGRDEEAKALSARHYAYTRAHGQLKASLGIPEFIETLDQNMKKMWAAALEELNARSNAVNGTEKSEEVAYDIAKRYAPVMDKGSKTDMDRLEASLRFKTWESLEAAKRTLSPAEYRRNSDVLIQRDRLLKGVEARAAAKAADAPKPGGILDWVLPGRKQGPNQPGSKDRVLP